MNFHNSNAFNVFAHNAWNESISIHSGNGYHTIARRHLLEAYFPNLHITHHHVDLRNYEAEIERRMNSSGLVMKNIMWSAFRALLGNLKHAHNTVDGITTQIRCNFQKAIDDDTFKPRPDSGLKRCRQNFRILAIFANMTRSMRLAAALLEFFMSNHRMIVARERKKYIPEWILAISELEPLIARPDFDRCMHYLVVKPRMVDFDFDFDDNRPRGRTKYLLPDSFWRPRSRTVPPRFPLAFAPARYPMYAPPPMLMPAIQPPSPVVDLAYPAGYFNQPKDAIQELADGQQALVHKVDEIARMQKMQIEALHSSPYMLEF
ncbi:hypothetical protein B0J11DRAFT_604013 [Dendryphion nanum]|uniref:Uncharacterized protein n=1 Tax=Dendryphion nanum TaxID=256645 RepID=A0A9P9E2A1_9PLEO|nr:hypothetical protein B0J11DRAFT_604013 [Dendryphion nanum]